MAPPDRSAFYTRLVHRTNRLLPSTLPKGTAILPYFPNFTPLTFPAASSAGGMWEQIFSVYRRAFEHSNQELWMSSARIVQEHAARAWIDASQSCMAALAENAAGIQQRAFAQLLGAQQQAATITTTEVAQALSGQ